MAKYTNADILRMAKEEEVRYVRLQFTDILGTIKAVEIPVGKLKDALDDKIIFDGSSIEGFVRIKEADMYLRPDLNTWLILPFEDLQYGKVARLICDVYTPKGKPFIGDPRYILKRNVRKMHDAGIETFNVGFEPEFYLFKVGPDGRPEIHESIDHASYFDLAPLDGGEYVRRDITLELEKLGFVVQTSHHEVGPGQNEVNWKYDGVLEACDRVQTFKQVVKVIARKHGYVATFMPKPVKGLAGSGMHTNCSLADATGHNLFSDPSDPMGLSLVCRKWMTGIINHIRPLAFLLNPTVNSYKRLVSGYEAPIYACWSDSNRSSLIRIPAPRGEGVRTEIRSVDPTANPYLALSGILAAGLDGIANVADDATAAPINDNLFSLTQDQIRGLGVTRLPENLHDAAEEFRQDTLLQEAIGPHATEKLLAGKALEWEEYSTIVTDYELRRYF
jgi:glutamine synthetase